MPEPMGEGAAAHWESIYATRPAQGVSWYRPHLDVSLALLHRAGLSGASRLIDIGGGASTLVDDLLDVGLTEPTVLDLSPAALAISRERLGERVARVRWLAADLLQVDLPSGAYDLWHDRAVLHFLTTAEQTSRYAAQASHAIAVGGHAVIGGFAPDGPERCSGLTVARRSPDEIASVLGPTFQLVDTSHEHHLTPSGNEQAFAWALLRRV